MHHDRKDAHAKLWSMIKDIRVAMLTSWDGQRMHSRPMYGHQEEFGLVVPEEDLVPEHFQTVNRLAAFVERLQTA